MIGEGMEEDEDGKMEWKDTGEEDEEEEDEEEEDNDGNEVTPGDVFALEMELNRENKKMMKVGRSLC